MSFYMKQVSTGGLVFQEIRKRGKYYVGMNGDVILIGLAFRGKIVRGKVQKISL